MQLSPAMSIKLKQGGAITDYPFASPFNLKMRLKNRFSKSQKN